MKLVPTLSATGYHVLPNGCVIDNDDTHFLFGSDFLIAARIRGTQALRATGDKAVDRLEGDCDIAVTEDWHTKMSLMMVNVFIYYVYP